MFLDWRDSRQLALAGTDYTGGRFGSRGQRVEQGVGTLTVDIFDGSTKRLIFRGQATDTPSNNVDKNDKKMDHAVDDMFKKFPPAN